MGDWSLRNLERGAYAGNIYPVNPGYDDIRGLHCYASLADLPERPDLVMFAVGDHRVETTLDQAIALQIPAAIIMSSLCVDDDTEPFLKARVQKRILDSGMLVCGANGMGFYNIHDNTWACGFDSRKHPSSGNVSLISHSGSGMSGIIDCEARLRLNFAVSTGNELSVTMDQYLDFALDLPGTKVVGLFIETARNPEGFRAALAKATAKNIPIIALKVGRTSKSAALAVSHSGAMAGDDDTYQALFDYYGVHRVSDMDELATALILFDTLNPLGPGGLVSLHDSGGERQLMVDLADETRVPLTELTNLTVEKLTAVLDPELPAVNPLDGWSRGGETSDQKMTESISLMMQDEGAAVGALVLDRAPDGVIYRSYIERMKTAHAASGKPIALVGSRQGTGSDPMVAETTYSGFPIVDGVIPFLRSVRGLMNYRDYIARPKEILTDVSASVVSTWRERLAGEDALDEFHSLALLNDFGIAGSRGEVVSSTEALLTAASGLSYPLVLKTAMPGMQHKTEHQGVLLGIWDEQQLIDSYGDLEDRLGPVVLLTTMAPAGVEMFMGSKCDPQFGPIVMLGFGGVHAEVCPDVSFALPPFDATCARRMLDKLQSRKLLDGVRGAPPAAIDEFCESAARFSTMVMALQDQVQEFDVNPVIVGERTCIAVDALVVCKKKGE
jgi:acyl-CoA synthetase (NDP forming)